jgi:hypothetical protein
MTPSRPHARVAEPNRHRPITRRSRRRRLGKVDCCRDRRPEPHLRAGRRDRRQHPPGRVEHGLRVVHAADRRGELSRDLRAARGWARRCGVARRVPALSAGIGRLDGLIVTLGRRLRQRRPAAGARDGGCADPGADPPRPRPAARGSGRGRAGTRFRALRDRPRAIRRAAKHGA